MHMAFFSWGLRHCEQQLSGLASWCSGGHCSGGHTVRWQMIVPFWHWQLVHWSYGHVDSLSYMSSLILHCPRESASLMPLRHSGQHVPGVWAIRLGGHGSTGHDFLVHVTRPPLQRHTTQGSRSYDGTTSPSAYCLPSTVQPSQ